MSPTVTRLAVFGDLAALAEAMEIETVLLAPDEGLDLAASIERAEVALAGTDVEAAVIEGSGDWGLGAALACAKALVPYAHLNRGEPNLHGGHVERLADAVIAEGEDSAASVQSWLTALRDS